MINCQVFYGSIKQKEDFAHYEINYFLLQSILKVSYLRLGWNDSQIMAATMIYYNQITMVKKAPIPSAFRLPPFGTSPQPTKRIQRPKATLASKTTLPSASLLPNEPIFDEEQDSFQPLRSRKLRARPAPLHPQPQPLKEEQDEYFPDANQHSSTSIYSAQRVNQDDTPILSAHSFQPVSEIDFKIFAESVSRSKIYSVMLVDNMGRIIFSDKVGHQLFEGSLNNFQTMKVQNLLLRTLKQSFLSELRATRIFDERTTFNWVIYSKNTKRRYSRVPFNNTNTSDTFYRFLKSITLRIRPINLSLQDYECVDGFWNHNLVPKVERDIYMLEAKLCEKMPTLSPSVLWSDPVLIKYIKVNTIKAEKWAIETGSNEDHQPKTRDRHHEPIYEQDSSSSPSFPSSHCPLSFASGSVSFEDSNMNACVNVCKQEEADVRIEVESRGVRLITDFFIDDL